MKNCQYWFLVPSTVVLIQGDTGACGGRDVPHGQTLQWVPWWPASHDTKDPSSQQFSWLYAKSWVKFMVLHGQPAIIALSYHLISSIFFPSLQKKKKERKEKLHDKRVVTSIRKAVKTLTLWSLLPWAVCFVKHFFSQCQAGITKCDNQMQIICMYNEPNSWTVQTALNFCHT